jgi:hypothetical protein
MMREGEGRKGEAKGERGVALPRRNQRRSMAASAGFGSKIE